MARASRHSWRLFAADERGAALVEMTIITPLMLTLAAGVFEFSNIIQTKLLLEAGVRDGALYIARCGVTSDCQTNGKNIAVTGGAGSARVISWVVGQVTVTPNDFAVVLDPDTGLQNYRSSDANVTTVEVTTSYPYTSTGLWGYLGFSAVTLTAAHEERVIGH